MRVCVRVREYVCVLFVCERVNVRVDIVSCCVGCVSVCLCVFVCVCVCVGECECVVSVGGGAG